MERTDGRLLRLVTCGVGLVCVLLPGGVEPLPLHAQDSTAVSLTDTLPRATLDSLITAGSQIFNSGSCTICHAVGGRGDPRRGPDLTDSEWLQSDGSFEGIQQTIIWGVKREDMKAVTPRPFQMNPNGGMPFTSAADLRAVTAYVWSLANAELPPVVAAQNEFLRLLGEGRMDEASATLHGARRTEADSLLFSEAAINRLGYEFLLIRSEPETAVGIFELNAELHPESWNVWDSLAEGHMVAGNRERAIEFYEKSLELNPENDSGREKLDELRRQ